MVFRFIIAATLVLLPVAAPAQNARAGPPDLILTGGKVFTADPARPWAEAVAVRGGRIVAVGTTAEVARLGGRSTRRIALGGRVVVPGFNDAHDHAGAAEYGVPFATGASPTPDPEPALVLDSLGALARRTPPGTWLHTVVGLRVLEDGAARREALDRVAPDHPVLLWGWTGHGAVVNTAGLRALGIGEEVRDPVGGWYERDAAGRLTGALREYAEWAALRRLYSGVPDSAVVAALRRYAEEGARLGITSVQSMNGYLDPAKTTRVLRAARLPIRFRAIPYLMTDSSGRRLAEWRDVERSPAPLSVVSGAKWVLDATPIERDALMREPYADRPGWHGRLNFHPDTVRAILAEALTGREQLMLHVAGDSTLRVVFAAMRALAPDSAWRRLRVRIEHGDWLAGDLLPVARRLGVVLVQNPSHFAFDPAMLRQRFGRVPAGFQQSRSILAAGVPVAIGSDGPRSPFLNLMFAVAHPTHPGESLTREQAVTAYTRGSAYAEFAEGEKGTLAPGMLADLAVLSQDVFTVPVEALPATTSVLTLVGGTVVHDELTRSPSPR
ncbi:MAG TPA: amidohydrolase [Longimicrobiaceae bacterium]|nr:amidohydrolase [Longimicrobiaceae bacterium]